MPASRTAIAGAIRPRLFVAVALVLLLCIGALVWRAVTWHDEYGTWRPDQVRATQSYQRDALDPIMRAMDGEVAGSHARGYERWKTLTVTGPWREHFQEFGKELQLAAAWYELAEAVPRDQQQCTNPTWRAAEHARVRYYRQVVRTEEAMPWKSVPTPTFERQLESECP